MSIVFLGLGSNIGNRQKNLRSTILVLEQETGKILCSSSVYTTAPWGFESERQFLNLVLKLETHLTPSELLTKLLSIEQQLGRVRNNERYSDRIIDIDILLYDDLIINEEKITIPHPLMHERKFVLEPLCEIAPDFLHPVLKITVEAMLKSCTDKTMVTKSE